MKQLLVTVFLLAAFLVAVEAAFLSSFTNANSLACSATAPGSTGCLAIDSTTTFCYGESNPSGSRRIPTLIRFDSGTKTWCRGSGNNPLSDQPPDSSIYGVAYDTSTSTLWVVGSADGGSTGTPFWTDYTASGFMPSYDNGGGPKAAIILKVDPATGNPTAGTWLRSINTSTGKTNSFAVTNLTRASNGNLFVNADTYYLPPGTDAKAIPANCVNYSAPLAWLGELSVDLTTLVGFCIDSAKYIAGTGCFSNTCPTGASATTGQTSSASSSTSSSSTASTLRSSFFLF